MTTFFDRLNSAIVKRRAYSRTVAELSAMNIDTALDLNIYHGDIRRIAHKAVYGK